MSFPLYFGLLHFLADIYRNNIIRSICNSFESALNPQERLLLPQNRGSILRNHIFYELREIVVKIGHFFLDFYVKLGYLKFMFRSLISFVLRISLIAMLLAFVWQFVEPKTQLMRILRAALLVLGLLAILAVIRITG